MHIGYVHMHLSFIRGTVSRGQNMVSTTFWSNNTSDGRNMATFAGSGEGTMVHGRSEDNKSGQTSKVHRGGAQDINTSVKKTKERTMRTKMKLVDSGNLLGVAPPLVFKAAASVVHRVTFRVASSTWKLSVPPTDLHNP